MWGTEGIIRKPQDIVLSWLLLLFGTRTWTWKLYFCKVQNTSCVHYVIIILYVIFFTALREICSSNLDPRWHNFLGLVCVCVCVCVYKYLLKHTCDWYDSLPDKPSSGSQLVQVKSHIIWPSAGLIFISKCPFLIFT